MGVKSLLDLSTAGGSVVEGPPTPKRLQARSYYGLFLHLDSSKVAERVTHPSGKKTPANSNGKPPSTLDFAPQSRHHTEYQKTDIKE